MFPAEFSAPPAPDVLRTISYRGCLHRLPAGTTLWRIFSTGGTHPARWNQFRHWGPGDEMRFDHHLLSSSGTPTIQPRGILYAALAPIICIAEYFQRDRAIDRTTRQPYLAAFDLAASLTFLNLTGIWPTRAGYSMAINSGPRALSRAWSCAIYEAYPHVQGLRYPSKMYRNRLAVALYERAAHALPADPILLLPLDSPLFDTGLQNAAHTLNYRLVP